MALNNKKYFNVRRFKNGVDMGVIDIPEDHLEMTLRNHPDWVNLGEIKFALEPVNPPDIAQAGFTCPICGAIFGSEKTLQVHKIVHNPITPPMVEPKAKPKHVKKPTTKRKRKTA